MDYSQASSDDQSLQLPSHSNPYPHAQQSSSSPAYPQFRHPTVPPTISGGLDTSENSRTTSTMHSSPASHNNTPNESSSMGSQQLAHGFYGDMARPSLTPSTPSNTASPRFSAQPPNQQRQYNSNYVPTDRSLPSRDVSVETMDDAYAAFILYCNPSFPMTTDTTELKKLFRTPPKSDGKSFSTWTLYGLICKLESKEIKTWQQLALDLGVEPPSLERGQSTQKVQQYSVRLKRWMRAMRIDAFFDYVFGRQHAYHTAIPAPTEPFPEEGRDGVPHEEDLAIRALDPKLRPKRGRKKNDEGDDDMDEDSQRAPKRPSVDTSLVFSGSSGYAPQSAYPSSAHPDDYVQSHDWTSISAITPASSLNPHSARTFTPHSTASSQAQPLRWRMSTQATPSSPHPLSAITPATSHPPDSAFEEPQSAVTPSSRSRPRRRHGPVVSSAWPSNNTSASGKLRGRPPSNRSVRDGPFVTFPANPKTKEGPMIDINRTTPGPTPVDQTPSTANTTADSQHFRFPPTPASAISMSSQTSNLSTNSTRPERLQLQVPQHVGNPVRLVTPPTLLVNGRTSATTSTIPAPSSPHPPSEPYEPTRTTSPHRPRDPPYTGPTSHPQPYPPHSQSQPPRPQPQIITTQQPPQTVQPRSANSTPILSPFPTLTHESLKRALAHDLLRADMTGRKTKLRGSEAKDLADALLRKMKPPTTGAVPEPSTPTGGVAEQVQRMAFATVLGLAGSLGLHGGAGGPVVRKRVVWQRWRTGGDGYESPIDDDDDDDDDDEDMQREDEREGEETTKRRRVRESADVSWTTTVGALVAECSVKGIVVGEKEGDGEADIRKVNEELRERLRRKEEELRELRDRILEAVM